MVRLAKYPSAVSGRDIVKVKNCVAVVPAEHLERRQVGFLCVLSEVGETDLPLGALAVVGDEQQVIRLPCSTVRLTNRPTARTSTTVTLRQPNGATTWTCSER